jgi:tRNA ligase
LIGLWGRNNHLQDHRAQLRDLANTLRPPARLLALNWTEEISSTPHSTLHRTLSDRVFARGANHQTLVANPDNPDATYHEDVIWKFLNTVEELQPTEVDEVVEMRIGEGMEEAVGRAVEGCVAVLGVERPGEGEVAEAVGVARGYEPKTKKIPGVNDSEVKGIPRYFAFLPETDLVDILKPKLAFLPAEAGTSNSFWKDLETNNRVTRRPHVTVVHKNSLPGEQDLWERCRVLHRMPSPPLFKFKLGHVVWNARVMAVTVDDVELATTTGTTTTTAPMWPGTTPAGQELVSLLQDDVKRRLHITVGTKDTGVRPVEAKSLVEKWRNGGMKDGNGVRSVELGGAVAAARLEGLFS